MLVRPIAWLPPGKFVEGQLRQSVRSYQATKREGHGYKLPFPASANQQNPAHRPSCVLDWCQGLRDSVPFPVRTAPEVYYLRR
jgi:hypothetical protein